MIPHYERMLLPIISLPPLPMVTADGQHCLLSAVLGPVWDAEEKLIAMEVLSRIHCRSSGKQLPAEIFFFEASAEKKLHILSWQLELVTSLQPWCLTQSILVSVNITRSLAVGILSSPDTVKQIQTLVGTLCLELSEHFIHQGAQPGKDNLIQSMRTLAPLWLDDFGLGSASLSWVMSGLFDVIKVDRHLFERLYTRRHGALFLHALVTLIQDTSSRVIVEGVEDEKRWQFARDCDISACQGWYWPEVRPEELDRIKKSRQG